MLATGSLGESKGVNEWDGRIGGRGREVGAAAAAADGPAVVSADGSNECERILADGLVDA